MDAQQRLEEASDERRMVPPGGAHTAYAWNAADRLWRHAPGAGFTEVMDDGLRSDPVARLLLRYDAVESGEEVHTADGSVVRMDDAEIAARRGGCVRGSSGAARTMAECRAVSDVAMGLHMRHHFTDAWGVDGSKTEERCANGWGMETRAGCGVYGGVQPGGARDGESVAEAEARCFGAAMYGVRLPASYEVVDTELHAILEALRRTTAGDEPHARRCLIVSDCAAGLWMVEQAWRRGVAWKGQRAGRAGLLHAINMEREKLELVVMMWAPAHKGGSVSAYADAAAKAGATASACESGGMEHVCGHLPGGRSVLTVRDTHSGRWGLWPVDRHTAYRDAAGWWVLRKMARGGRAGRAIDEERVGRLWTERRVAVGFCEPGLGGSSSGSSAALSAWGRGETAKAQTRKEE